MMIASNNNNKSGALHRLHRTQGGQQREERGRATDPQQAEGITTTVLVAAMRLMPTSIVFFLVLDQDELA